MPEGSAGRFATCARFKDGDAAAARRQNTRNHRGKNVLAVEHCTRARHRHRLRSGDICYESRSGGISPGAALWANENGGRRICNVPRFCGSFDWPRRARLGL
ncbi:hypothetical protein JCM14124_04830 [Humidesulfovibrio idahonensis]